MRFIFLSVLFIAIICLQIFLSNRKNKWVGLILPFFCFLLTLLIVPLNIAAPATGINTNYINLVIAFVILNIPTIIFMTIYCVCRKHKAKKASI